MDIYTLGAIANLDPQAVDAIASEELTKPTTQLKTLDANGDPLIVGAIYENPRGEKLRVLSESFGSGNCMDTYYRVHYQPEVGLEEKWLVVDASWKKVDGQAVRYYQSQLRRRGGWVIKLK